jgi:hypothetical protein
VAATYADVVGFMLFAGDKSTVRFGFIWWGYVMSYETRWSGYELWIERENKRSLPVWDRESQRTGIQWVELSICLRW